MRIAYDHQIFQLQKYGGISRYFVELARIMASTPGMSVKIISPLYINAYLAEASPTLPVLGRYVPPVRYTGRLKQRVNAWLVPQLLSHFRPDLVHETYYSVEKVSPTGVTTVLTVYDMIHDLFPDWFSPGWAASVSASQPCPIVFVTVRISRSQVLILQSRLDQQPEIYPISDWLTQRQPSRLFSIGMNNLPPLTQTP